MANRIDDAVVARLITTQMEQVTELTRYWFGEQEGAAVEKAVRFHSYRLERRGRNSSDDAALAVGSFKATVKTSASQNRESTYAHFSAVAAVAHRFDEVTTLRDAATGHEVNFRAPVADTVEAPSDDHGFNVTEMSLSFDVKRTGGSETRENYLT